VSDDSQPEQQWQPGYNPQTGKEQGRLKRSNTVNVGRIRKEVRLKCAIAAKDGVEYWDKVARGLKVVAEYHMGQKRLRYPTHAEKMKAIEHLVEIGIGRDDKLEVENTGRLTNEDRRRILRDLAAEAQRGGSPEVDS
jgi:hypothetical protein